MTFMITKFIQRTWFVYVQILLKLPVVFAEIRPPKPKIEHVFGSAFGFGSVSVSAHM